MIGTDDLLACFIAGNVFTHECVFLSPCILIFSRSMNATKHADRTSDWFRLETMDDSLQPTVDMLLNLAVFLWFGAVCPWSAFAHNDVIPIYRLIILGILILLFRRLPVVIAMHKGIHQIEQLSHAAFVGFFGPIGVGAIFYLSLCREFLLEDVLADGEPRADAQKAADTAYIVVWFLVICSIVCLFSLSLSLYISYPQSLLSIHRSNFTRWSTVSACLLEKQVITFHEPFPALSACHPPLIVLRRRHRSRSPPPESPCTGIPAWLAAAAGMRLGSNLRKSSSASESPSFGRGLRRTAGRQRGQSA
jgi:hypothetical protein